MDIEPAFVLQFPKLLPRLHDSAKGGLLFWHHCGRISLQGIKVCTQFMCTQVRPTITHRTRNSSFWWPENSSQEVEWGKVSLIAAERLLLANALLDISNQRFVLLSESCIPLYNFSTVYSYLMNSTQTFVEVFDDPSGVGRGRYELSDYLGITIDQWRKGSQWFQADRDLALEFVSDQTYFPVFMKCKGYCFSDEHYLPTFVYIKFGAKNANRTLTWVDWEKGGPHPTEYASENVTAVLLSGLRNGFGRKCEYNGRSTDVCFLFGRKFPPTALDNLLKFAPEIMHFNT